MQNHFANNSSNVAVVECSQKNFRPESAINNLQSPRNGNAAADKASSSFIDTSIFASSSSTADILNNALENDLIDLTANVAAAKADDLFSADIDFMNNYLKSLPDYNDLNSTTQQQQIRLREHPTPKPFHNVFGSATDSPQSHVHPPSPQMLQKHGVSQSPQLQRKPNAGRIPLSKSSSLHTFTKQQPQKNYFGNAPAQQSQIYHQAPQFKETCVDEMQQNNKISRSTSSNSMIHEPPGGSGSGHKEGSDFMGFMRKPSSLMNIFKKLGSQSSSSFSPSQQQSSHDTNTKNMNKTQSVEPKKSISDFWKENVVSSQQSPKFGWNYHKIIPQFNQPKQQVQTQPAKQQLQPPIIPSSPSAKHKTIASNSNNNNNMKKMEPAVTASKPIFIKSRDSQPKKEIVQQESPKQPSAVVVDGNLNKSICDQEFHKHKSLTTATASMNDNNSNNNNGGKFRENVKQAKEEFLANKQSQAKMSDQDNTKLLKSSSNSHIYMNQDDPNYLKNLHKITKSLNNATEMMVNKQPLHKSVSNSSVPNYLATNAHHAHLHHPHAHHLQQQQYPQLYFVPSSAPVHAPAFIYPAFAPPEVHMIPKSNIPICYKYQLHKSSSNSSMTGAAAPMGATTIGFYSVSDKPAFIPTTTTSGIPILWPTQQQQQQAYHTPHIINKSSSSSCIYAKTLSQPAHLSKNNGIFARYKPILSDNPILSDDNDSDSDDDISKHSNASCINNVPAPPPFGNNHHRKHSTSSTAITSTNSAFTPFTKISSIQIQINGQLPSPFKSKNAAATVVTTMERQEGNQQDICQRTAAAAPVVNNKSNETQSIAIKDNGEAPKASSSNAMQYNRANNIFYNFIQNPLTATQNIASMQMQAQQDGQPGSGNGVGDQQIYTPYTKYLSDRKYFDMNVCEKASQPQPTIESQRRNSGTTASSCANKSTKLPMAIPKTSAMTNNAPSTALINKSTSNHDILSAFDPYYVNTPNDNHKTSNKLHQLLTTVANEQWSECKKKRSNDDALAAEDGSDLFYNECATAEVDER